MSIISIVLMILSYLLAPIIVLFANKDGWLPSWLSWFQTPDNSLDGDAGWNAEHFLWVKVIYLRRVLWLWRNPVYGFGYSELGAIIPNGYVYESIGDELTSNLPLHAGQIIRKVFDGEEFKYFQFYFVRDYNLFGHRCVRINLGWKLWGELYEGKECQFVCSVNPWMTVRN